MLFNRYNVTMGIEQNFYHEQINYGLNLAFCGREACVSGHSFGPAKRVHYLLHFITKGKGSYHVNGRKYPLVAGDAFLIVPGDITYYTADQRNPWSYLWVAFEGPDTHKLLEQCGFSSKQLVQRTKKPMEISSLLTSLVDCALNPNTPYLSQLAKVFEFFSLMSEGILIKDETKQTITGNAINFIENNYSYDIKVTDIAKAVCLERTYLYRQFMNEIGLSPKDYLTKYRLKMAKEMLTTEHSITEVAFTCGFLSSSAFHKHFKDLYGITPTQYRKSL